MMFLGKDRPSQQGFAIIPIALGILSLAILGSIGYGVYQAQSAKPEKNRANNARATSSTASTSKVDPYEGWKMYCDEVEQACFRYPEGWELEKYSTNGISAAMIKSPDDTLTVYYTAYYVVDGHSKSYYVASVDDLLEPDTSWKIVGRLNPDEPKDKTPEYQLVDRGATASLMAGQTTEMIDTARFTFKDQITGQLEAHSVKNVSSKHPHKLKKFSYTVHSTQT